jgi:hypothetical protein
MKGFKNAEAIALRKYFKVMMPVHLVNFLLLDLFLYGVELFPMLMDGVFMWLAFYAYMTLHKVAVGAYCGGLLLSGLVSISHIQRILFETDNTLIILPFFIL